MVDNDLQDRILELYRQGMSHTEICETIRDSFGAATREKKQEDKERVEFIKRMKENIIDNIANDCVVPADVGYMAALVLAQRYPTASIEMLVDAGEDAVKDVYGDI